MKYTGIVLILLGLIAGAVVVVQMVQPTPAGADVNVGPSPDRPDMTIPLAVCGAAVVIGGLMLMFGRRSYFLNNDPRVRN